jgi:hypothetical protein
LKERDMDVEVTPSTDNNAPVYVEKTDPVERQQRHRGHTHIDGWGADADPAMRPAFPKERTPPRLDNVHWREPETQRPAPHRIHHSTERPGLTPVFGTSVGPSGLSGLMRDVAFRYSENDLRHWLILLGADRVNVVEGLLDDLAHGHVPNLWKEMGLASEWRYNRKGFVTKVAAMGAAAALAMYVMKRRRARMLD